MEADIRLLGDALVVEIFNALGFAKTGGARRTFGWIFRKPTNRLASLSVTADRMIAREGFSKAAAWMLTHWCRTVMARGTQTIPPRGPLLVVSNHAGSYDSFVIASQLGREDLKLISSDIPFLRNLPNASAHLIFLSDRTHDRMIAARAGIRHLQAGGSLLLYGTGLIDPDLEVYPDAERHLAGWSASIDLFLRAVPQANVLVTFVSGVVSKRWAYHPVTWLKRIDWQKRRLAEFGQVIEQLFFPGSFYLSPHVSFALPASVEDLQTESTGDRLLPAVIARGQRLLAEHKAWIEAART
jgi:hypothetical protein